MQWTTASRRQNSRKKSASTASGCRSATSVRTFHDPIHLAEALAAIDNLSRGRFVFGAGVGYHEDYFRCFGVPFERRGKRFEEVMDCIVGAWTEEEFNYGGEFFQYEGVRMTPKPYQRPRPPRFRAESHGTRVEL